MQEAVDGARSDAGGHGSDTGSEAGLRTDGRDELGHPEATGLDWAWRWSWVEHLGIRIIRKQQTSEETVKWNEL